MLADLGRVSIVIPTYNQAKFLGEALQGLLDQTYPYWDAIVVNNFSTDDTATVVGSFQDPRIRLINFANQGVIAASRNLAISESSGEFVAFLDSDDTWYPKKLELCLKALQQGYDMVCHGQDHFVDGDPTLTPVIYGPESKTKYERLLADGNCLSTSASVVRRKVLLACGNFSTDPSFNTSEDYDLWLKISRSGARIKIMEEMLGAYRVHNANTSASKYRQARATFAVLKSHLTTKHAIPFYERLKVRLKMLRIGFFILRNKPA